MIPELRNREYDVPPLNMTVLTDECETIIFRSLYSTSLIVESLAHVMVHDATMSQSAVFIALRSSFFSSTEPGTGYPPADDRIFQNLLEGWP